MYPWQLFILGLCEHLVWPLVAIGFLAYYKKDIRKILERIKTLPGGTELMNSEEVKETRKEQREAMKSFDEEFIQKIEKRQLEASEKYAKEGVDNE